MMNESPEFEGYSVAPIHPFWRLHPYLPLSDAAALLAGYDPSQVGRCQNDTYFSEGFPNFWPAVFAMTGAVLVGELPAEKDEVAESKSKDTDIVSGRLGLDPRLSRVKPGDVKLWLLSKGHSTGYFFDGAERASANYLDPTHKRYAPKLAAAVHAWQAVEEPGGKSPKQALMKWLREHSAEFGLSDEEGKPNETGIEECAKVANWVPGGGAAKTPDREA